MNGRSIAAVLVLLLLPVMAGADEEFGEESAGDAFDGFGLYEQSSADPETVVVPDGADAVKPVEFNQVPTSGSGTSSSLFGQPAALLSQTGLPPGALDLPFVLLPVTLDADQDGLSNNDERLLGTDPQRADTDGDTFIDGLEIVRGFNPLVPSPGDKVTYAVQRDGADTAAYAVTGVRLEEREGQPLLVVTGMAPEHGLVLLVVASDGQRVWAAQADSSGRFLYTSADTLEPGDHTIQAAAPTVAGNLAVGEPFQFRRTGAGVELVPSPDPSPVTPDSLTQGWLIPVILLLGGAAVLGVMLFFVRRAQQLRRARGLQTALQRQLRQAPPDS